MDVNAFKRTLFDVLKYDNTYKEAGYRERLLIILTRGKINFVPQFAFATRSYQHWEVIELRVPVPLLNDANFLMEEINQLFYYVYEETDEYALQRVDIKPMVIDSLEEFIEHEVYFDEIEDTITQGIRDAKFMIWAVVAWFSNDMIYKELLVKKSKG